MSDTRELMDNEVAVHAQDLFFATAALESAMLEDEAQGKCMDVERLLLSRLKQAQSIE